MTKIDIAELGTVSGGLSKTAIVAFERASEHYGRIKAIEAYSQGAATHARLELLANKYLGHVMSFGTYLEKHVK